MANELGELGGLSKRELLRLLDFTDRQVEAYDDRKLQRYDPHPGQDAFHRSDKKIRLLCTGNRYGKTTCSVLEAVQLATGTHPYKKLPIPNRGKMYGESFPVVMETFKPKFDEWIPKTALADKRPYTTNQMGYLTGVNFKNGSQIKIGSYDQEVGKAEGSNWHYCIEGGQKVLMEDGSHKPIAQISEGDVVAVTDGKSQRKFSRVLNTKCNGMREVIKITTNGGHSIECTPDHKIYINYRKCVEAGKLRVGDKINRPVFMNLGQSKSVDKDDCFLLGSWIGDGWCDKSRAFMSSASDEFIDIFNSKLPDGYHLKHRKRYDYVVCNSLKRRNTITRNHLMELIKRHGLYGRKAFNKFVPDEIFKQDGERRLEFLRGLYATDGWASWSCIGYGSTSEELSLGVKRLLESFGIKCGIYFKKKQDDNWRDQWFVLITTSTEKLEFCKVVGIPSKETAVNKVAYHCELILKKQMARWKERTGIGGAGHSTKQRVTNSLNKKQNFKIKKIENVGVKRVYDIEVEKYHNFICEGFKVHNCAFDEPPSRELYVANMRGLVDFGGYMWFSMTPLKEAWIYDELWQPGMLGEKDYIECFGGSSDQNPHINKDALNLFLSELTKGERETRFLGKFARLLGLVIDTYRPEASDIEPFDLNEDFVIYEGIDPHTSKPHCVLWKAIDKNGYRYACSELKFEKGVYDLGVAIAQRRRELTSHGAKIVRSVTDTSINTEDMNKVNQYQTLKQAIIDSGETVLPMLAHKKDWLLPGIEKLKDLFRVLNYGSFESPTEFLFKGRVPNYRYGLLHYQWPNDITGGNEKPKKANDDFIDPSRYIERLAPEFSTPGQSRFLRTYNGAYTRRS